MRKLFIISGLALLIVACNETTEETSKAADTNYLELGQQIAADTKAELGKNLMGAIKEYGTAGAVTFCNTRAIPLTDSMAMVHNASIKRVSDQPRNPDNTANEAELAYIKKLKANMANGNTPEPQLTEANGKMVGYYPIVTNGKCLQCHGSKDSDILPETYTHLQQAYPNDQATGYSDNQLRGIWVVTMEK